MTIFRHSNQAQHKTREGVIIDAIQKFTLLLLAHKTVLSKVFCFLAVLQSMVSDYISGNVANFLRFPLVALMRAEG